LLPVRWPTFQLRHSAAQRSENAYLGGEQESYV